MNSQVDVVIRGSLAIYSNIELLVADMIMDILHVFNNLR